MTRAVLVVSLEESSSDIELSFNISSVLLLGLLDLFFNNNGSVDGGTGKVSDAKVFNILVGNDTIAVSVEDSVVGLDVIGGGSEEGVEGLVSFSDHGDTVGVIDSALSALVVVFEDSSSNLLGTFDIGETDSGGETGGSKLLGVGGSHFR